MTRIRQAFGALFLSLALAGAAGAQQSFQPMPVTPPWLMQAKLTTPITVTTSSGATQLPTPGLTAWFCNTGAFDAYYTLGAANTVATTKAGGSWLKSGTCTVAPLAVGFNPQSTWVAFIGDGGSTTVYVETGMGSPPANASSGTITGTVTANQGTSPWVDNVTQWGGTNVISGNGASGAGGPRVSIANDNTIPTGWPTSAKQDTGNTSLASIDTKTPALSGGAVPVTPAATEIHLGEVGGNLLPITNDLTTTNATVTTGQSIGGLQTLANAVRVSGALGASGTSGLIQSVLVSFKDAVATSQIDVFFFNASPSGSTCTNASAFILADADRDKVIGVAHITDFTAGNTAVVTQAVNQAMPYGVASATSIFACIVARGSFAITGTANASLITRVLRN